MLVADTHDYLQESDLSDTGAAGKLIRLGSDKTVHANIDGSAQKIDGIEVDSSGIKSGSFLSYDAAIQVTVKTSAKAVSAAQGNDIAETYVRADEFANYVKRDEITAKVYLREDLKRNNERLNQLEGKSPRSGLRVAEGTQPHQRIFAQEASHYKTA